MIEIEDCVLNYIMIFRIFSLYSHFKEGKKV
jgi:hypothetical protein